MALPVGRRSTDRRFGPDLGHPLGQCGIGEQPGLFASADVEMLGQLPTESGALEGDVDLENLSRQLGQGPSARHGQVQGESWFDRFPEASTFGVGARDPGLGGQ